MPDSPFVTGAASLTVLCTMAAGAAAPTRVYFGTYTGGKDNPSEGIYTSLLDPATGAISQPQLAAKEQRPSFLALHPDGQHLYAVCSMEGEGKKQIGGVSAFSIDRNTGQLNPINRQPSEGDGPCHVSVDKTGRCAMVANYGSGSVAALQIAADGSLRRARCVIQHEGSSVNPKRQTGPHAHSIFPDPSNRFACAPDLGIDKILIYRLDPEAALLEPNGHAVLPPGSGPRHIAFHPSGRFAYSINELKSTITSFTWDASNGVLSPIRSVSTLPPDFSDPNTTAEIKVHPNGKFLYGSNRGHDSIAVFTIDQERGGLRFVEWENVRGKAPRNFNIDPSGAFLLAAGQDSDSVAVFRIDPTTGALDFAGHEIKVPRPVCVLFLPPISK
ncbi:MAG TPA: lactonase family protein [Verrucomicrobiae bacterium]|nr:lactonase family protein [Verrucomicrobiae bacterium]